MEDYNKIIDSLSMRFDKARHVKLLSPFNVSNFIDIANTLFLVHKGDVTYGADNEKLNAGDILFVPSNRPVSFTYGGQNAPKVNFEMFLTNDAPQLYEMKKDFLPQNSDTDSYSFVSFSAKVFDSLNFFTSLDIPPFTISGNTHLRDLMMEMTHEELQKRPGYKRVVEALAQAATVECIRYILEKGLFVEKLATNTTYFKDLRLINIFNYIKQHISGDLSNKTLAQVIQVSEDYVGQYFKMLTGINPQDYIEYQRMEMAVHLLRSSKKSIKEIGHEVGYNDTAYFCRRYKMMFGIPAGKMRRREVLANM